MKKLLIIVLLIVGCSKEPEKDTISPTIIITYPINNSIIDKTTTIKVDVADNGEISNVKFLIDGLVDFIDTEPPYEYEWDACVLGTGNHTVLIKAEDISGNEGQSDLNTYTLNASYDCFNVCGGDKLLDNCDVCDADSTNDCNQDCSGEWGGSLELDECGVCGGDNSTCLDCAGVPNGDSLVDMCKMCDNDSSNNCVQDCVGEWGGDIICGCTDETGCNYNSSASFNDGSCTYPEEFYNCNGNCLNDTDEDGLCDEFQGTVNDVDDNIYQTIQVGEQIWMAENLKVTHYNNGNSISYPSVKDFGSYDEGQYGVYDNDPSNADVNGNMYNFAAVDDDRGLCMEGWHVPSDTEFMELELFLGMSESESNDTGLRGTEEGGKLKEAGLDDWNSPNKGATNESGFTGLPAGYRDYTNGSYYNMGGYGYFWSSSEANSTDAWARTLYYGYSSVYRYNYPKRNGFSIRCLRD